MYYFYLNHFHDFVFISSSIVNRTLRRRTWSYSIPSSATTSTMSSAVRLLCRQRRRIIVRGGRCHHYYEYVDGGWKLDGRLFGKRSYVSRNVSHQLCPYVTRRLITVTDLWLPIYNTPFITILEHFEFGRIGISWFFRGSLLLLYSSINIAVLRFFDHS